MPLTPWIRSSRSAALKKVKTTSSVLPRSPLPNPTHYNNCPFLKNSPLSPPPSSPPPIMMNKHHRIYNNSQDSSISPPSLSPSSSSSLRQKLKSSLCCFHSHSQRDDNSVNYSSDSQEPRLYRSTSMKVKPQRCLASHDVLIPPELKDKCKNLMSRIGAGGGRHRRRHSADFKYDPLSYALNFDEGENDDGYGCGNGNGNGVPSRDSVDVPLRNFASRLPASPPHTGIATPTYSWWLFRFLFFVRSFSFKEKKKKGGVGGGCGGYGGYYKYIYFYYICEYLLSLSLFFSDSTCNFAFFFFLFSRKGLQCLKFWFPLNNTKEFFQIYFLSFYFCVG